MYEVHEVIEALGFDPAHQNDILEVFAKAAISKEQGDVKIPIPDSKCVFNTRSILEHALLSGVPYIEKWLSSIRKSYVDSETRRLERRIAHASENYHSIDLEGKSKGSAQYTEAMMNLSRYKRMYQDSIQELSQIKSEEPLSDLEWFEMSCFDDGCLKSMDFRMSFLFEEVKREFRSICSETVLSLRSAFSCVVRWIRNELFIDPVPNQRFEYPGLCDFAFHDPILCDPEESLDEIFYWIDWLDKRDLMLRPMV